MGKRLKLTEEQQRWLQTMTDAYDKFKDAGGCMVIHADTEECFAFNGQQTECIDFLYEEDASGQGFEVMDDKMNGFRRTALWIPLWDYTKSMCIKFKSDH